MNTSTELDGGMDDLIKTAQAFLEADPSYVKRTPEEWAQLELARLELKEEFGLKNLRLSYGPGATPESVKEEFRAYERKAAAINQLPSSVVYEAQISYLKELISKIYKLGQTNFADYVAGSEHPAVTELKHKITQTIGIVPDMDVEYTLRFAKKRGCLPEGIEVKD